MMEIMLPLLLNHGVHGSLENKMRILDVRPWTVPNAINKDKFFGFLMIMTMLWTMPGLKLNMIQYDTAMTIIELEINYTALVGMEEWKLEIQDIMAKLQNDGRDMIQLDPEMSKVVMDDYFPALETSHNVMAELCINGYDMVRFYPGLELEIIQEPRNNGNGMADFILSMATEYRVSV